MVAHTMAGITSGLTISRRFSDPNHVDWQHISESAKVLRNLCTLPVTINDELEENFRYFDCQWFLTAQEGTSFSALFVLYHWLRL